MQTAGTKEPFFQASLAKLTVWFKLVCIVCKQETNNFLTKTTLKHIEHREYFNVKNITISIKLKEFEINESVKAVLSCGGLVMTAMKIVTALVYV